MRADMYSQGANEGEVKEPRSQDKAKEPRGLWPCADGSKKELSRSFERFLYVPFVSKHNADKSEWTHTPTDMSGVDARVKAIAESAWTDDVKTAFKAHMEKDR